MTIQELEQCIALYGKDIYSFCRHLANDRDLADDLYQDTFLEALKKISDIRYRDNPKSYLLSIALRIWKNRVRKIAWRNRIAPTGSDDGLSEMLAGDGGEILGRLVEEEERRQLWHAIGKLPDRYRIPILLFYMEELSISEIARLLALPQGTVKSRLYHARQQLKKELEGDISHGADRSGAKETSYS
jgi:RNA polymerase sigma-70 factor (ECF subfamily)